MGIYFFIASLVILLDLGTKALILNALTLGSQIEVTPFFNLVLAMNKGISFSMFSGAGAWVLTSLAIIICAFLIYFMVKEKNKFCKTCLALILGGAIGNIVDRIRFKAVVDFLDFHAFGYHWPAFNIADSAICIGVALLLFHMTFYKEKTK